MNKVPSRASMFNALLILGQLDLLKESLKFAMLTSKMPTILLALLEIILGM